MNCCNKPPKGGSTDIAPLLKAIGIFAVIIVVIAAVFG